MYGIVNVAMSADGFIADKDGGVDWLPPISEELTEVLHKFVSGVDAIVMGANSYAQMLGFGENPYADKRTIVFTSRSDFRTATNVEFLNAPVNELKKILGDDARVWIFGGANLIGQLAQAGLLNEWRLFVVPVVLGDGLSVTGTVASRKLTLELVVEHVGAVELRYQSA